MTARPGVLRLATRRSTLATTQSTWVADRLRALGHEVELVPVVTEGDVSTAPLTALGGVGVFAKAIRRVLLAGGADFAVHSLKDLPTAPYDGLVIAAVPQREDPRDALIARDGLTLRTLPPAAVVGTGSPRRAAQLALIRPDLRIVPIRGNVERRLSLIESGECDAVVLAMAGLTRLGRTSVVTDALSVADVVPAAGQGALAVECPAARPEIVEVLSALEDPATRECVTAERALLARLEAGCSAPVGAFAQVVTGPTAIPRVQLTAFVGESSLGSGAGPGRSSYQRQSLTGPPGEPVGMGERLADLLLSTDVSTGAEDGR